MAEAAETPLTGQSTEAITDELLASYQSDDRTQHLDSPFLPSRDRTIQIIEIMRRLVFPGFFDEQRLTNANIRRHIKHLIENTRQLLYEQIREALHHDAGRSGTDVEINNKASRAVGRFVRSIPELRRKLALDIQASYDGDPAAKNTDEAIFCYPGIDAVFIYRIAHELYLIEIPLIPRIMTEYAHNETGVDIHPGAQIGESFFIDHGTGVVIGETTVIGNRVQVYQNVTLGALSPKDGDVWRGRKRHPTIEDDVTIYPNTTILGGETTIGARCVINGSVFLTRSVPPDHTVGVQHPEPQLKVRRRRQ